MSDPVVHFEIIGANPAGLRDYYAELFGWTYDVGDASAEEVSAPGE
jgi:predicted enzyme related to lactoylglutathione lyase